MTIGPLFDRYPLEPGFKARGTSEEAAASMKPTAATLRESCLYLLYSAAQFTADEMADLLGASVLAIRPRITELKQLGKIEDSGERRPNASGRKAVVWRAVRG